MLKFKIKNEKKIIRNFLLTGMASMLLIFCSGGGTDGGSGGDDPDDTPTTSYGTGEYWLTRGDGSVKLQKQTSIDFNNPANAYTNLEVDASQTYQSIDGFGYTLTGGSVEVINQLTSDKKTSLLNELFGSSDSSIGVSYLRISIGASDLNSETFSYDDMPSGETDEDLSEFSLSKDQALITMLKTIKSINSNIKIIATPWSAPVWMKDNGSTIGGSLKTEYYDVYAQYFVKYIQAMQAEGITIDAVTPQNEPLHDGNNPSMYMTAAQQRDFIKNNLGPAFLAAGISTKIIIYDHNADNTAFASTILSDSDAAQYVDGSAFHLYAGDISALSTVRNAYPTKNIYFTEQYTASTGDFSGDLGWHMQNVIIGATRNWSKNALEWNLANNSSYGPHTEGGCTTCKGAITVSGSDSFERNVAYYIIAHASKFVPQNSVRISSAQTSNLSSVAFKTPTGKIALIVYNSSSSTSYFNIKYNGNTAATSIPAVSVATYVF